MSEDSGGLSNSDEDEPPDEIGDNLPASINGDEEELQEVIGENPPASINGNNEEQHLVGDEKQQGQCLRIVSPRFSRCFCYCPQIIVITVPGITLLIFLLDMRNQTSSQNYCMVLNAQLANFENQKELDFLNRKYGHSAAWIGLHRESSNKPWMWTDNTEYNNLTLIRGDGNHAYLTDRGISSSRDYIPRRWICSKPKAIL